jgi:hypothetical protein
VRACPVLTGPGPVPSKGGTAAAGAPRPASRYRYRRQVSWLADLSPPVAFPGYFPQWPLDERLSAYSCGGSCGIGAQEFVPGPRTAFPLAFQPWKDRRRLSITSRQTSQSTRPKLPQTGDIGPP